MLLQMLKRLRCLLITCDKSQEKLIQYQTLLNYDRRCKNTDDFYVVFQGKALQTTVPPDDFVTTARINDGAVTSGTTRHKYQTFWTLDVTGVITPDY